jgi:murein DD-endopeptidase MepM/ murein hydrolase activator NlpD
MQALPSRFIWPVKGQVIGQFGRQEDGSMQEGVVIEAPAGTNIQAAADGEVVYVGAQLAEFGQMIILRHDNGYMTSYAHAHEILVSKGQKVRQGDTIARVGKSGNAPSPRLHFTVRAGKHTVDPMPYLLAARQ